MFRWDALTSNSDSSDDCLIFEGESVGKSPVVLSCSHGQHLRAEGCHNLGVRAAIASRLDNQHVRLDCIEEGNIQHVQESAC